MGAEGDLRQIQPRTESNAAPMEELRMTDRDEWTKGWDKLHDTVYEKRIGDRTFLCIYWWDKWRLRICAGAAELLNRDTLEECQILAHETARLWAGEGE